MLQIAARVLYPTDPDLAQEHMAADAKVVGDALTDLNGRGITGTLVTGKTNQYRISFGG